MITGRGSARAAPGHERDPLAAVTHFDREDGPRRRRHRRITYACGWLLMVALVLSAVTDRLGWTEVTGTSTRTSTSAGGGYELTVRYPAVTRPALAAPFDLRIERSGGFDGPVRVAVSWAWIEMWDENGWNPPPAGGWADGERLVLQFDPPPGDVLRIVYDGRIQPSQQQGRDGTVAVVEGGRAVASVHFHTRVLR
ncbi:MAG: hypothetical protein JNK12_16925 [Acidimicrobiales bacterium]|nr:hypothetical protein [Acidimicrobiales bacterium]